VLSHIDENRDRYVDELIEFLRIPSISSLPGHTGDVRKAAQWLTGQAQRLGFKSAMYETPGHPLVYAELCPYRNAPTLVIYGHYDVQPPGPLEKWSAPPFAPAIKDGAIYARGAVDDKGQILTVLKAIESILAVEGRLPMNVKLLFEGEEEIGSPNMETFVRKHDEMLRSDALVVLDVVKYRSDLPAIYYGIKGFLAVHIQVTGPRLEVHSGIYGGAVANPAQALARIIDSLKDGRGRIRIPGFYDHVRDIEPWEREEMASLPFDEASLKAYLGVTQLTPEEGYTALECMTARPTLDVSGVYGGAFGAGLRVVIPASASALISMRLVSDQDPDVIYRQLLDHINSLALPGVSVNVSLVAGIDPVIVPQHSEAIRAAKSAIEYGFGRRPVMVRIGGSSGIVAPLRRALGIEDIVITGWGDPGEGEHSPDEHFSLDNFRRGIMTSAALIYEFARQKKAAQPSQMA
jgi:acetylornithine deacetylase/succinyl-diaminopimelate desuccinylase-like protein